MFALYSETAVEMHEIALVLAAVAALILGVKNFVTGLVPPHAANVLAAKPGSLAKPPRRRVSRDAPNAT